MLTLQMLYCNVSCLMIENTSSVYLYHPTGLCKPAMKRFVIIGEASAPILHKFGHLTDEGHSVRVTTLFF